MSLIPTYTDRRFLEASELWKLCQDAARIAVRAPYGPDDRAECAMDLYGAAVETVAAELETVRHGAAQDVLRYIDRAMLELSMRPRLADSVWMPLATDRRFTFTALRNRAEDWRRSRDAQRSRDELMSGKQDATTSAPVHQDERKLAEYLARGAAQDSNVGRTAATAACQALNMAPGTADEPSPVWCLLYQWSRGIDAEAAAAELGVGWASWRKRTSRAAATVRDSYSAAELIEALCGAPVWVGDELRFALEDASREAHGRTPIMAQDWRDGTAAGEWPERPLTAAQARGACRLRKQRPAPAQARARRDAAHQDITADHARSRAMARAGLAAATATGRPLKSDVGRTSGKPII